MSEKARRRAGLDYWDLVDCREHTDWSSFLTAESPRRLWLFSTHAQRPLWNATFARGDYFLFGNETSGLPDSIHQWCVEQFDDDHRLLLPMVDHPRMRSLNLATVVCAAVYEGIRQTAPLLFTAQNSTS
jgi:tRNA (cytidine/uridine-2'-O-)-methyltransferase